MPGHKASKVSTSNGSEQKESGKLCWVGRFRFSTGHVPTDVQSEPPAPDIAASSPQLRCALLLLKPPFLCELNTTATIDIKYLNNKATTAVSN